VAGTGSGNRRRPRRRGKAIMALGRGIKADIKGITLRVTALHVTAHRQRPATAHLVIARLITTAHPAIAPRPIAVAEAAVVGTEAEEVAGAPGAVDIPEAADMAAAAVNAD
jgi:hypothetical protein